MQADRPDNTRMMGKLLMVTVLMFAFGFALVPFYEKICEVTGINILSSKEKLDYAEAKRFAENTQVDYSRKVSVEFDANSHGTWTFKPRNNVVEVHPGELVTVIYEIKNHESRDISGQAIPSYAPKQSAAHFKKLECFCFEQQVLKAGETREFPVVFVVAPELPDGIRNITLSYTFFEVGIPTAQAPLSTMVR
ncbi:MAG: cytochrome c oxidase assembly protein [Burkholderiaceae bacterium]|jgi:cytochrome c oxidase assembly protein subunit 11